MRGVRGPALLRRRSLDDPPAGRRGGQRPFLPSGQPGAGGDALHHRAVPRRPGLHRRGQRPAHLLEREAGQRLQHPAYAPAPAPKPGGLRRLRSGPLPPAGRRGHPVQRAPGLPEHRLPRFTGGPRLRPGLSHSHLRSQLLPEPGTAAAGGVRLLPPVPGQDLLRPE